MLTKSFVFRKMFPYFVGLSNTANVFCGPCVITLRNNSQESPLSVYTHMHCCYKPLGVQGKFEFIDLKLKPQIFLFIYLYLYRLFGFFFPSQRKKFITNSYLPKNGRSSTTSGFPFIWKVQMAKIHQKCCPPYWCTC